MKHTLLFVASIMQCPIKKKKSRNGVTCSNINCYRKTKINTMYFYPNYSNSSLILLFNHLDYNYHLYSSSSSSSIQSSAVPMVASSTEYGQPFLASYSNSFWAATLNAFDVYKSIEIIFQRIYLHPYPFNGPIYLHPYQINWSIDRSVWCTEALIVVYDALKHW